MFKSFTRTLYSPGEKITDKQMKSIQNQIFPIPVRPSDKSILFHISRKNIIKTYRK